jgi:hypothetical protein
MGKMPKLGTGQRFSNLTKQLSSLKGERKVDDPAALAAWIGRKKYGKARFQKLAEKGK